MPRGLRHRSTQTPRPYTVRNSRRMRWLCQSVCPARAKTEPPTAFRRYFGKMWAIFTPSAAWGIIAAHWHTQDTCCSMSVVSSSLLAPFSCKEREWTLSGYDGVVWSPATHHKRAMYACRECDYEGDRFYHTKKHHMRIHVLHGKALVNKRKYQQSVPAASLQAQKLQKRALKAMQTRTKFAGSTLVKVRKPPLQQEQCAQDSKRIADTQQQVLTFGEFNIKWAPQSSVDKNVCYQRGSASNSACDPPDAVQNTANKFFPARLMPHDADDWKSDTMYGNLPMFATDCSGTRDSGIYLPSLGV